MRVLIALVLFSNYTYAYKIVKTRIFAMCIIDYNKKGKYPTLIRVYAYDKTHLVADTSGSVLAHVTSSSNRIPLEDCEIIMEKR